MTAAVKYDPRGKNVEVRGKDSVSGDWILGDLITGGNDRFFIHEKTEEVDYNAFDKSVMRIVEVDPDTIGEDLDVHDIEKVQLFEGDIISFDNFKGLLMMDHGHIMYMTMNENGSTSMDAIDQSTINEYMVKKIGNLWDTPDLWRL